MKKNSTLFFIALLIDMIASAAAPTVPASNLGFKDLDGARFTVNFTAGNGANRIVVMREGAPVVSTPVNGVEYNANSNFGTTGTGFGLSGETALGEFVVGRFSWSSYTVANLKPGTIYYVAVFEYNGTGSGTQYLNLPLSGSQSTVTVPAVQTSNIFLAAATGNSLTLGWTKGDGNGRLVIARKTAAVSADPTDLINYYNGDGVFGSGTKIGTDNFVVYKGSGTSALVKNLEPNTTYHFAVYEYNGNISPVHAKPAAVFSATTFQGPTVAPTAPGFNYVEGNSFTINVTVGNGSRRLFIAKKEAPVTAVPVNGVSYSANAVFGSGMEIAPGEFVVAATNGTGINVTNLEANTVYHFRVYEYDVDNAGNTYYLTSSYAVKSGSAATTPTVISSGLSATGITGSSATIKFTPGNGTYRMVIMKAGSAVDAVPADLTKYPGNSNFGEGTVLSPGNYSMYWGMNGSQFTVNKLQPGTTYHVSIYEFNGSQSPVYSAAGATISFTVPLEPTAASTSPWTAFTEGTSFRLIWTNGSGARRIVVAKKGGAVTARPVDGLSYTAKAAFGQGQELGAGEYVVYDGIANNVDLTNMEVASTYHFAIYEYNVGPDGKPDYLSSSWLATSASTVFWPVLQTTITSISGLQATQATVNYARGDGASSIFIMKQGAPVGIAPQDLVKYNASTSFGAASSLISDGNYVVAIGSGTWPFTVTNLQPNTTYYLSAFEFNGSSQPAYLRTAPGTYAFTTPDVPGATVPTVAATNPTASSVEGNKFTFNWANGNGEKRIVVMKQGSAVSFVPANAVSYTGNAAFGMGTDLGEGQYIVYNGAGSSVDLTNLLPSTTYHFAVYEYNGTGSLIRYLTSSVLTAATGTTFAPSLPATTVNAIAGTNQLTLSWTKGNGSGRLVVMKEGSALTAAPADLSVYPANSLFQSGAQIAAGEYVVYSGSGSTVTVTGLAVNKTYYFGVFEYNGAAAPVYQTTTVASGSVTLSSSLPVRLLYFTAKEINGSVELHWATAQEVDNEYFTVERSYDGISFKDIKIIAGQGNSNAVTRYSYSDLEAAGRTVYYRLKQTDRDGKFTYSLVQVVEAKEEGIRVYPNPVQDHFAVDLPKGVSQGRLFVYDEKGALISRQAIGRGQKISSARWSRGIYYLRIQTGNKDYHQQIIKK